MSIGVKVRQESDPTKALEAVDYALRKLKHKLKKDNQRKYLERIEYFTKPSAVKRRKYLSAIKKNQTEVESQKRKDMY
jgi:ribosomal protein S21